MLSLRKSRIGIRIVSGFIFITVLLGSVTYVGLRVIKNDLIEIVRWENPKIQAILEMEINIKEAAREVLDYLDNGLAEEIQRYEQNIENYFKHYTRCKEKTRTAEERSVHAALDALFGEFQNIAKAMFAAKDRQDKFVNERDRVLNEQIEVLLNDKLQSALKNSIEVTELEEAKEEALYEMEINVQGLISATRGYLIDRDLFLIERIRDSEKDFAAAEGTYNALALSVEERQYFDALTEHWANVIHMTNGIIRLENEKREWFVKFDQNSQNVYNIMDNKLQVIAMTKIFEGEARALHQIKVIRIVFVLTVMGAVVMSLLISQSISKPITALVEHTKPISEGRFDTKINIASEDEIGQLGRAFNEMMDNLKVVTASRSELNAEIAERKQAAKEARQANDRLLESEQQLKALVSELVLTEERLKRSIASQLHDEISQSLAISQIDVGVLRQSLADPAAQDTLKKISQTLAHLLQETRSLTTRLSYPILNVMGFETAVEQWLVDEIERKYGMNTRFDYDGQATPLSEDIR